MGCGHSTSTAKDTVAESKQPQSSPDNEQQETEAYNSEDFSTAETVSGIQAIGASSKQEETNVAIADITASTTEATAVNHPASPAQLTPEETNISQPVVRNEASCSNLRTSTQPKDSTDKTINEKSSSMTSRGESPTKHTPGDEASDPDKLAHSSDIHQSGDEVKRETTDDETTPADTMDTGTENKSDTVLVGLHITAIRKFLKDHPSIKADHLTTSQINSAFVKPETIGTNQPYTHKYTDMCDDTTGAPLISSATVFVSHAWRYSFYDVVVDIMEQHAMKNPDAYFWFDLFTNNQNEVASKDFHWFSTTFRDSIRSIGQVLLTLSPWNDPIPLHRAWCLFEIHKALEESDVELIINLPTSEVDKLSAGVVENPDCVTKALSDIQAEKAEAKSDTDRQMIFEVIQRSDGGFLRVNQQVKDGLRSWYVEQLQSLIQREPENDILATHSTTVMQRFGFYEAALQNHQRSLGIYLKTVGENHPNVACVYSNMAHIHYVKGDMDRAFELFHKSLTITVKTLGQGHPNVASIYGNMALIYENKGEFDEALRYSQQSLAIKQKTFGENHPTVGIAYNNLGGIYATKGDLDKAEDYLNKSLANFRKALGDNNPAVAECYNDIGEVYQRRGDLTTALSHYNRSLAISRTELGESHDKVADTLHNVGVLYKSEGKLNLAMENLQKALEIRQVTHGLDHQKVSDTRDIIAQINVTTTHPATT